MAKTGGTIFVPEDPFECDAQQIEIADGISHRFILVTVDDREVTIRNQGDDRVVWRGDGIDVIDFAKAIANHVRGDVL